MNRQLTVIIEREGDGYVSFCPDIDVASQGATVQEAAANARYQGAEASFSILDGALLSGSTYLGKSRLVQAWIEIHREDLIADWQLAVNGEAPLPPGRGRHRAVRGQLRARMKMEVRLSGNRN